MSFILKSRVQFAKLIMPNSLNLWCIYQNGLILSRGDQAELRKIFRERGLDGYFDGSIFGSLDDKDAILKNEKK